MPLYNRKIASEFHSSIEKKCQCSRLVFKGPKLIHSHFPPIFGGWLLINFFAQFSLDFSYTDIL